MHFNWIDYSIVAVIGVSVLISLMRGFMREALSLLTWGIASWAGLRFSSNVSYLFNNHIANPNVKLGVAFVCIFVFVLIIGMVVARLFSALVNKTGLSSTDRLLGIVFGAARGVLVICILLICARFTALSHDNDWKKSVLVQQFAPAEQLLQGFMQKHMHRYFPEQKPSDE